MEDIQIAAADAAVAAGYEGETPQPIAALVFALADILHFDGGHSWRDVATMLRNIADKLDTMSDEPASH